MTTQVTDQIYYGLLNMHPDRLVEQLVGWLEEESSRPCWLEGPDGSGRSYLLRAAAYQCAKRLPVAVVTLECHQLLSTNPHAALADMIGQGPAGEEKKRAWRDELADAADFQLDFEVLLDAALSIGLGKALRLGVQLMQAVKKPEPMSELPAGAAEERLFGALARHAEGCQLVVCLRGAEVLDHVLSQGLVDFCKIHNQGSQQGRIRLCFASVHPLLLPAQQFPLESRSDFLDLQLLPIDRKRMEALLHQRFQPHVLDAADLDLLFDAVSYPTPAGGRVWSPALASLLGELIAEGALVQQEAKTWQLDQEAASSRLEGYFTRVWNDRINALKNPALKQAMQYAALCRPIIPLPLILETLAQSEPDHGLADPRAREILQRQIHEQFLERQPALLTPANSSSPLNLQPCYRWRHPIYPEYLSRTLDDPGRIRKMAAQLLATLDRLTAAQDSELAALALGLAAASGDPKLEQQRREALSWYIHQQAGELFTELLQRRFREGSLSTRWALVMLYQQQYLWPLGQQLALLRACEGFYQAMQAPPDLEEAEAFHRAFSEVLRQAGRADSALPHAREVLRIAHGLREMRTLATAHDNLGKVLRDLGEPEAARGSSRRRCGFASNPCRQTTQIPQPSTATWARCFGASANWKRRGGNIRRHCGFTSNPCRQTIQKSPSATAT